MWRKSNSHHFLHSVGEPLSLFHRSMQCSLGVRWARRWARFPWSIYTSLYLPFAFQLLQPTRLLPKYRNINQKEMPPISLITSLEHCLLGRRRYQSLDSRVKICRISTCRCVTRSPLGLAISLQLQNRLPVVPLVRVALGLLKLLLLPPANEDKKLHHTSRLGLYDSS